MAKYERVKKEREEIPEEEVRLSVRGSAGIYINRCATLLLREEDPLNTVRLKGTGMVMSKVALVANIIVHKIKGLH